MNYMLLPCFIGLISLAVATEPISFNQHIRPILSDKCYFCHGPDEENNKADLRLDTREGAFAALGRAKDRFAIVPGKPDESELLHRVLSDDPDELMPPPEKGLTLSLAEKDTLRQWIEQGAEWQGHWSFEPLSKPALPAGTNAWGRSEIDAFVSRGLAEAGLAPQPEADRLRLQRRASFGLTGLPPTDEELKAFTDDTKPGAYERMIDRLLASPRYGERMAVDWLDVARYADTYGFQVDRNREVWPWRDWVVRAFNDNLSYDKFLTWQVAGDLLPEPSDDQVLATTFSRLHQQKVEGGSTPEEFRVEYVADRLHTFGTAFMGLTFECCRCHDHKYDPLSAKEYYQMFAYFQNINEAGLYSYFTPSVPTPTMNLLSPTDKERFASLTAEVTKQEAALAALRSSRLEALKSQQTVPPPPAPLAWFSFDEAKTGKHASRVSTNHVATSGGGTESIASPMGRGLKLSGDDAVKLSLGDFHRHQPFSISLQMQTPDLKGRAVILRRSRAWTDAASRGYELLLEDGKLSVALIHFEPGNSIRVRAVDAFPLKSWHEVVLTYDGSSRASGLRLFMDGKPLATEIIQDCLTREIRGGGEPNLALGERMRDRGFKQGLVDEVKVWDRELVPDEIAGDTGSVTVALIQDPAWSAQLEAVAKARRELCAVQERAKEIMVMQELPEPKPAFILNRGAYDDRGEPVEMATPKVLPPFPADQPNNRLGLARWLTQPDHPLTARVFVNRIWQQHFGEGLVRTPEDFGSQGASPTHPELLDWLCATFVEDGWDIKQLHKRILLSATYRQASRAPADLLKLDPENKLLARAPVFRLSAEEIRDNALYVSGLLDLKMGGAGVKPYDQEASFKPAGRNTSTWRRSIYTWWRRTGPAPAMMALDAVKRDVCAVKRETTSSPLQALVLLNGTQFVEAARVAAERVMNDVEAEDARFTLACRRCLGRPPAPRELAILRELLAEQVTHFTAQPEAATQLLGVGDKKVDAALAPAELAAWTSLLSALFNHDECVTRR